MNSIPPPNFRSFLQQELLSRCKKNPGYSLRAFARLLRVEPSALSKILHGKRQISKSMFQRLARRLDLAPVLMARYQAVIESPFPRSAVPEYEQLTLDTFQAISEWYHFAILELTYVKGFRPESQWISNILGITVSEVNIAVERLLRLQMLEIGADGNWTDRSGAVTTVQSDFTSAALKKVQRQLLEMASDALERVPISMRDQTGMTMAINTALLPEARERIKHFRRELCEYLSSVKPYDDVYQLNVSLFPLTELNSDSEGVGQ